MAFSLLTEKVFTIKYLFKKIPKEQLSLPEVLHLAFQNEPFCFPKLQAHQKHHVFTFFENLAALCVLEFQKSKSVNNSLCPNLSEFSAETWRNLLENLSGEHSTAFDLYVDDRSKPAFFQPPTPLELKTSHTKKGKVVKLPNVDILDAEALLENRPDNLPTLVNSKDWDVKKSQIKNDSHEHWVYAIITTQTGCAYTGKTWYATVKMASGQESRIGATYIAKPFFNTRMQNEVPLLLKHAKDVSEKKGFSLAHSSHKLLWLITREKDEKGNYNHVKHTDCHALFIDAARVFRLERQQNGSVLFASIGTDSVFIENGKAFAGDVGDFWLPIGKTKEGESAAIALSGKKRLDSRTILEVMQNKTFKTPAITHSLSSLDVETCLFHIEALIGEQCKTLGFYKKYIVMTKGVASFLASDQEIEATEIDSIVRAYSDDVETFWKDVVKTPIHHAIASVYDKSPKDFKADTLSPYLSRAKQKYDSQVENIFLASIVDAVAQKDGDARDEKRRNWLKQLDELADAARDIAVQFTRSSSANPYKFLATVGIYTGVQQRSIREKKYKFLIGETDSLLKGEDMSYIESTTRDRMYAQVYKAWGVIAKNLHDNVFLCDLRKTEQNVSESFAAQQMFFNVFGEPLLDIKSKNKLSAYEIKVWQYLFAWMSRAKSMGKGSFGAALQKSNFSEIRLKKLLNTSEDSLISEMSNAIQYVLSSGKSESSIPWVDVAWILLTDGVETESETSRTFLADSYYKAQLIEKFK